VAHKKTIIMKKISILFALPEIDSEEIPSLLRLVTSKD
jgi:hypothetical protein